MNSKYTVWAMSLFVISAPLLLAYLTFTNSIDCSQLVIDTYEVHSGINIPEIEFVSCHYDEALATRISVYELKGLVNLRAFEDARGVSAQKLLRGWSLLAEQERPPEQNLQFARGEKWGRTWTYVLDPQTQRLWAELNYSSE